MRKQIVKALLLAQLMLFPFSLQLLAQDDCDPVKKLRQLYNNSDEFRCTVDQMFQHIQDLADGTKNPWQNKNVEDLYAFMNEWFYFLPNTDDGLDYILEFSFLYYRNPHGMKFILEEPGRSWSLNFVEERGRYMDSAASASRVMDWLQDPELNNNDFVLPLEGFHSFNEFFTRNLRPGARPIDGIHDHSVLVAPADGVINMINNDLKLDSEIPTKGGKTLDLVALLDSSSYCPKFVGGTALAVFLLPTDYHHFHAPVTGTMVESKQDVGDRLFGMPDILDIINDGNIAYNKDYSVFQNFRHGYYLIKTEEYGYIAMIPIGLQTIGSVVFEDKFRDIRKESAVKVYKGEKLGHFAYGGSTVLLLFEKDRLASVSVRMGQKIGSLKK